MKIKKLKNTKQVLKEIAEFCNGSLMNEVCGLVGFDGEEYIFQEGKNIANDPRDNFVLDPLQYLVFKDKYKIITIFHSHLVGDEQPSDFDVLMSENSCVPFTVYSLNTKKYYLHKPADPEAELELIKKLDTEITKHNVSIDD